MGQGSNDRKLSKLNYCLLFAKYFLYCQKLNKNKCDFNEFITKLQGKQFVLNLDHSLVFFVFVVVVVILRKEKMLLFCTAKVIMKFSLVATNTIVFFRTLARDQCNGSMLPSL